MSRLEERRRALMAAGNSNKLTIYDRGESIDGLSFVTDKGFRRGSTTSPEFVVGPESITKDRGAGARTIYTNPLNLSKYSKICVLLDYNRTGTNCSVGIGATNTIVSASTFAGAFPDGRTSFAAPGTDAHIGETFEVPLNEVDKTAVIVFAWVDSWATSGNITTATIYKIWAE